MLTYALTGVRPGARQSFAFDLVIWLLIAALLVSRFVGLDASPPGFWVDEFYGALHQVCLQETGRSAYGEPWPLFVPDPGGGYYTPAFLYLGALWVKVFGPSTAAFRSLAAFAGVATVVGVHAVARRSVGSRFALWAALLAAVSPWSFHFARIAWDPPLAPAFLIWSYYFWHDRQRWVSGICAGVLFALALYTYPPVRIQGLCLFAFLLLVSHWSRRGHWSHLLAFAVSAGVLLIPLAMRLRTPEFNARGLALTIWTSKYLDEHHGQWSTVIYGLRSTLDGLALHFRPSFLLLTGDENVRHSSQLLGELSGADLTAFVYGGLLLLSPRRMEVSTSSSPYARVCLGRYFQLCAAGALFGILPAALTWESTPHALRSIGAWPFLSLFGGGCIALAEARWSWARPITLTVALIYAGVLLFVYFCEYPKIARDAFSVPMFTDVARAMQLDENAKAQIARRYPEASRIYLIQHENQTCRSSQQTIARWSSESSAAAHPPN